MKCVLRSDIDLQERKTIPLSPVDHRREWTERCQLQSGHDENSLALYLASKLAFVTAALPLQVILV